MDGESGKAKKIIVQVKSGHVGAKDIRELQAVVEREGAAIGAFLTLEEPTRPMREEAVAGFYEPPVVTGRYFPRIQVPTIADLLAGRELEYPKLVPATFKRAPASIGSPSRRNCGETGEGLEVEFTGVKIGHHYSGVAALRLTG